MKKYETPKIEIFEAMTQEFCNGIDSSVTEIDGGGHGITQVTTPDDFGE